MTLKRDLTWKKLNPVNRFGVAGGNMKFAPYPDFLLEIIGVGGLYPILREKLAEGDVPMYVRIPPPQ